MKYKIIGNGSVVTGFLAAAPRLFPTTQFEVYTRSGVGTRRLEDFQSSQDDFVFICCSVDEANILRSSSHNRSRLTVAKANLNLLSELTIHGMFNLGTILVLTNPSDLMAEYLSHVTSNPRIYALGLSADQRRYRQIFAALGATVPLLENFSMAGNHWDCPVPRLESGSELKQRILHALQIRSVTPDKAETTLLVRLHDQLQKQIQSEFAGFKPPVQSGVQALIDSVSAFNTGGRISVSGKTPGLRNFVGGTLQFNPLKHLTFRPNLSGSPAVEERLAQTFSKHRLVLDHLMSHQSQEVRRTS